MEVDADQVEVGRREGLPDRRCRVPGLDGEAELAVEDAGGGHDVRVGIDARRESEEHVLVRTTVTGLLVQEIKLMEAVDDEPSDTLV